MGCLSCCKSFCAWTVAIVLYLWWGLVCQAQDFWSPLVEWPQRCEGGSEPALAAAGAASGPDSGVKVLVAGIAKMGTRTFSRSLFQLGLDHSYHSEEFGLFLWGPLSDDYWLAKSGGRWSGVPRPGVPWEHNTNDMEVLNNTSPTTLATALARCEVDAVAFDGIERAFWPILDVSPNAKVILLNWRSFEEWKTSLDNFLPLLMLELMGLGTYLSSLCVFPWGIFLRLLDPLFGSKLEKMLKTGGPPICQVLDSPYVSLFHILFSPRRIASRWFSGLAALPETKAEFDAFHAQVKAAVPADRLMEWNMKKHKWEDLCRFLEMENCPKSGRLPRAANAFLFLQDFPFQCGGALLVCGVLHWLNFKIICAILRLARRLLCGRKQHGKVE